LAGIDSKRQSYFASIKNAIEKSYPESGETLSAVLSGKGDTHMSSSGILPMLSTRPGVEVLRGNAAENIKFLQSHLSP
jgi:hypothetical protein